MLGSLARFASLLLFATFAWAGAVKLLRYERWSAIVDRYALPSILGTVAKPAVPVAEGAIAIIGAFFAPRIAAAGALAALALFSLAVLRARSINGDRLPCGCFGGSEERHYRTMILRNGFLGALAASVLLADEPLDPLGASMPGMGDALPLVLVLVGVLLGVWTALQVVHSMKRSQ